MKLRGIHSDLNSYKEKYKRDLCKQVSNHDRATVKLLTEIMICIRYLTLRYQDQTIALKSEHMQVYLITNRLSGLKTLNYYFRSVVVDAQV